MPIEPKINEELIKKIKEEQNPQLKVKLIGLYDVLMRIYEEDDKFDKITRLENFRFQEEMREKFEEVIKVMKGEVSISSNMIKNPQKFFTKKEMESELY